MESPRDEVITVDNFTAGLNLVGSPITFAPGETDVADNIWLDLEGSAYVRPPLTALLAGSTPQTRLAHSIGTEIIDTVGMHGFGQKATVTVITETFNTAGKVTTRTLRVDDLSPNVAPAQASDLIWGQLQTLAMPVTSDGAAIARDGSNRVRYRPTSHAALESEGYIARPDGRVLHFSPGSANAPVLLNQLGLDAGDQSAWNSDYENPANPINVLSTVSGFPPADVILAVNAASSSWMFAARGKRVRWSHSISYSVTADNNLRIYGAQDWALNDFTDLATTGSVTAMAHFQDHVLVFTANDTFALYGSPPDQIQVTRISGSVGTVSPHSVAVGPEGVWFYSHPEGLHLWDGSQMRHVSEKLGGFEGEFHSETPEVLTEIAVGYKDRRVWLSVPAATADDEGHTFVFDIRLGSYVKHLYQATQFLNYDIGEAAGALLAVVKPASNRSAGLVEVGQVPTGGQDRFATATGTVSVDVNAKLRVGPMRGNVPDMRPRWKRLTVATEDVDEITLTLDRDGEDAGVVKLGPSVTGLRTRELTGRAWRLGLLFEWKGVGRLVAVVARWWRGRPEGRERHSVR